MEFLNYIFNGANAVPTALLLFVLLYWLIVIFGVIGTDFIDFDLDLDADADLDTDVSADISWLNNVLLFFNLSKVPFMIWLSFLALPAWLITININGLFGSQAFLAGLPIFLGSLFVSLFIAKFLTLPFVSFFQKIDKDSKKKEIIGKVGRVTLGANHLKKGMAEVNYNGSFLNLYILTAQPYKVKKGESVLFIDHKLDLGAYLVEPYETIN